MIPINILCVITENNPISAHRESISNFALYLQMLIAITTSCYANILDHLENIRDKKILILEERDRHLGMIGVVNQLIQQKSKKELFMATHILHLFNQIK